MSSAEKFDAARAEEFATQSRIALAGYDAFHQLSACMLSGTVGRGTEAEVLVVGAGGSGQEIITAGQLEPAWRFHAVDPSSTMLATAKLAVDSAEMSSRTSWYGGYLDAIPAERQFDACTLIGVLHHVNGEDEKQRLLDLISQRLRPGAPFVLACNRGDYRSKPLFLSAWETRWRQAGTPEDEISAKLGKILQGAEPPKSNEQVEEMLSLAGFERPQLFFSSLFWGAWIARRREG